MGRTGGRSTQPTQPRPCSQVAYRSGPLDGRGIGPDRRGTSASRSVRKAEEMASRPRPVAKWGLTRPARVRENGHGSMVVQAAHGENQYHAFPGPRGGHGKGSRSSPRHRHPFWPRTADRARLGPDLPGQRARANRATPHRRGHSLRRRPVPRSVSFALATPRPWQGVGTNRSQRVEGPNPPAAP